jgi:hypothetical protein
MSKRSANCRYRPAGKVGLKVLTRSTAPESPTRSSSTSSPALCPTVGFALPDNTPDLLKLIPGGARSPAYYSNRKIRKGAWVVELTGLQDLDKKNWLARIRVIIRKEQPHPGVQLRIRHRRAPDHRVPPTNTHTGGPGTQPPDLEVRHRRRARCEDRIRCAKDAGLTNLPPYDLDQNRIWCAIITLSCEITAWMQILAMPQRPFRRWEAKRLRLRLLSTAAHHPVDFGFSRQAVAWPPSAELGHCTWPSTPPGPT